MKITSSAARIPSGSAATGGIGRGHAQAVATATVGLVLLVTAHTLPWVAVRPGQSIDDRLLGRAPSTAVHTYALADLPGARVPLYVGWALLLALLVVAGIRPGWRRGTRIALAVLAAAGALLTFAPGGAALRASGFRAADGPATDFLAGTWLALLAMLLVVSAVLGLTATPKPAAVPARAVAAEPGPEEDLAAPTPIVVPRPGWARGPVRVPWWRRPGPVTGVIAGGLAAATLLGAVIWQIAHRPKDPHGNLPALLVARPADSAPATPAAADDQVDALRLMPSGGDVRSLVLAAQLRDVRHAAGTAWTRPDSATMTVTLVQFASPDAADEFHQSYRELAELAVGRGGVVEVPGLPGATAFSGEGQGRAEVDAVAHRGDTLVLVTAAGGPAETVTAVEAVLREQYHRL